MNNVNSESNKNHGDKILNIGFEHIAKETMPHPSLLARVFLAVRRCFCAFFGSQEEQRIWKAFSIATNRNLLINPLPVHHDLQQLRSTFVDLCLSNLGSNRKKELLFYMNIATWTREKTAANNPASDFLRSLNKPEPLETIKVGERKSPDFILQDAETIFKSVLKYTELNQTLHDNMLQLSRKLRSFQTAPLTSWKILWYGPSFALTRDIKSCKNSMELALDNYDKVFPISEIEKSVKFTL